MGIVVAQDEVVGILQRGAVGGGQHVVDISGRSALAAQADAARHVGLGIDIDKQDLAPFGRECGREIDGGRGLSDAALLIGNSLYLVHLSTDTLDWSYDQ